jgi:uncharacterized membrane protein YeaQ/YmgE (transglycosylase-associated protein family)
VQKRPVAYGSEQTRAGRTGKLAAQVQASRQDIEIRLGANIMNLFVWLIVGGVVGWLASLLMKTSDQQGMVLNVVVGVAGAMLAGWFITPLIGVGTINQDNFSLPALLVSLLGASILLAIVNLFNRGGVR